MAQSLELLLIQFLMPDNDARRQAEEQIKRLAKDPEVIPALVHHLRTAKTPNVRQLAAVLLRKKITGHWAKLNPHTKHFLKSALIDSITLEHSPLVRRASANVVSIISKYAVPSGEWPELLPFLFQCSQSSDEGHREVSLVLFSSLAETIGPTFQSHIKDLQPVLLKCLQDEGSTRVRVAALKAVGSFIEFINDGVDVVKLIRDCIPSILGISRQCLASGNNDIASIAFEIFDELIESPAPFLGDSVKSIVQFSLEVCTSQSLEINIRHQAIQIISWLSRYKAAFLRKNKLVVPILQVMCPLLTETASEDDDADLSVDRAAAEVIDTMALNLPKHVFPPVFEFASLSFNNVNPKYREAAVTALGVISEGCFEILKERLESVLQIVLGALKDQEHIVRGAASFALGQFAEHLQPEILVHYEDVLPSILNALNDGSDGVKEKSYYALAAFCEEMGEHILPYLDPLMGRLVVSLQNSPRNLQETCMSAIGSIAVAAEQAFTPYAEGILRLMKSFMVMTNDEDLRLRARATELVGIIAMAVGRSMMEPVLHPYVEAALSGYALDFTELREYTHGFFSNIAEMLGDGFVQFLPHVVPPVFASCNLDDGSAVDIDDSDSIDSVVGAVSSDDDTNDEPRVRNISVRTGILDEKAAATQAIGVFALHTKVAYAPYMEESMRILVRHAGYFHEDVRLQAMIALKHILTAVLAIPAGHSEVVEKQNEVLDTVITIYLKAMSDDDDKEVVAQVCTNLVDIIKDTSYLAIEPFINKISEATLILLRGESTCQQLGSDSEQESEVDNDEELMGSVFDILPAFAKAMGAHFDSYFVKFFDPVMKFVKASHPPSDRTMVVACLAEIAQYMGSPISSYVDRIMPVVLKELSSSKAISRRNAAFCVGELCKNGGVSALKYFGDVLQAIYPLFGEAETDEAVKDNAAGAIARMIMANPQSIPLNQVLPIFLRALPLKEDHEESAAVYSCIQNLIVSSNPQILVFIPEVVKIFAQVVASPDESDEVKAQVGTTLSHLMSVYGPQMQQIVSSLSVVHANALVEFASKR